MFSPSSLFCCCPPAHRSRIKKDNDARSDVRTLQIGNHYFLATRWQGPNPKGTIERYEIEGDILREYFIDNEAALDFLQAKHPTAMNIRKNTGEGRYLGG